MGGDREEDQVHIHDFPQDHHPPDIKRIEVARIQA
jgi:hypothetical protein